MKVLLAIFLLAVVQQSFAQRFILSVAQRQNDQTTFRCVATAFSARHVLTTASCANADNLVLQLRNFVVDGDLTEQTRDCEWLEVIL